MLIEDDSPRNVPEYSVGEISGAVKRMVEGEFAHIRVRGELGRISRPASGHLYLDLKDDRAVLAGVVWKGQAARLAIRPQEGDEVIATGRLTTFPGQSKYQIVIESLDYAGEGALLAKLERLKKALAAEGLFAGERKRPLPYLPRIVGVITSPSGAVIRDILHRLAERFPVHVLVWPVPVQGAASAPEVAAAIRGFGALSPTGPVPRPDLLIVARGGGSVEDLWGFNDEAVVRAAAASEIPLISAVGHETDTTLIDLAADRRAPTPTAAAEMAVPVRADLAATLSDREARRARAISRQLADARQRLGATARSLPRPARLLEDRRQRLDIALARLPAAAMLTDRARTALAARTARLAPALLARRHVAALALSRSAARLSPMPLAERAATLGERLADRTRRLRAAGSRMTAQERDRLASLARMLAGLGWRRTLDRGFAVLRDAKGSIVTRKSAIRPGETLEIELADGRLAAEAGATTPRKRKPPKKASPGDQGSLF